MKMDTVEHIMLQGVTKWKRIIFYQWISLKKNLDLVFFNFQQFSTEINF